MFITTAFMACIVGVLISGYIFVQKQHHRKLACPRDNPCDTVLHSRFSRTFGLSNELLGIIYFFSVSFLLYLVVCTNTYIPLLLYILFFFLVLGGLFSVYLVALQAFVIKHWCLWCLGIALTNLILIISLYHLPFLNITPILASQKIWWVIFHNIGFVLGLGGATITDIFFFRFLRDGVISREEKGTMDTLTNVIWVGLAILIVSGLCLFLPEQARHSVSSKFLLKMVVVGVIVVNGILLNMFVGPYLRRLSFEGTTPAKHFRRLAFALGGISFTSWYVAFFLGSLRSIPINFSIAIKSYIALIVAVVIGSQIAERYVIKKHTAQPTNQNQQN